MKVNEELIEYIQNSLKDENPKLKDAVNLLIKNYNKNAKRLSTILKQADKQQLILKETNEQLNDYKANLEKKVEEEIEKRKENEKVLMQQSKMAAMGEMIDAVAHQWKQPLNVIGMKMMKLADLAVYLTAAPFVTGECVTIDGGEWLNVGQEFASITAQPRAQVKQVLASMRAKTHKPG